MQQKMKRSSFLEELKIIRWRAKKIKFMQQNNLYQLLRNKIKRKISLKPENMELY